MSPRNSKFRNGTVKNIRKIRVQTRLRSSSFRLQFSVESQHISPLNERFITCEFTLLPLIQTIFHTVDNVRTIFYHVPSTQPACAARVVKSTWRGAFSTARRECSIIDQVLSEAVAVHRTRAELSDISRLVSLISGVARRGDSARDVFGNHRYTVSNQRGRKIKLYYYYDDYYYYCYYY